MRFYAGTAYSPDLLESPNLVEGADDGGVPMGGDLLLDDGAQRPDFLAWAVRDPRSAPLQRLQIVKGWVEGGEAQDLVHSRIRAFEGLAEGVTVGDITDNNA